MAGPLELRRAIVSRKPIRAAGTDMLRIVDGAADGLDGIEIADFTGEQYLKACQVEKYPS